MELYKKYRPKTWEEVVGQEQVVKSLKDFFSKNNLPHAILLQGMSGVGKTTIARIIKEQLNCGDIDYKEINCALVDSPIETVRRIGEEMWLSPAQGSCRIWLLDEIQALAKANFAQQALLKMLEDTPRQAYFILATTDPDKVLKTIKTRCTTLSLSPLDTRSLTKLLNDIWGKETGFESNDEIVGRIVDVAGGSAREALVLLNRVINLPHQEALDAILSSDTKKTAIDIARAIMKPNPKWSEVAALLKELEDDPEKVRRLILEYASSTMLNRDIPRAYLILQCFRDNWYDCGKAGLVTACYEVCISKE